MALIYSEIPPALDGRLFPHPRVLSLGVFDGMHRGHQRLIRRTVEAASLMASGASVSASSFPSAAWLAPNARPPAAIRIPSCWARAALGSILAGGAEDDLLVLAGHV